MIQPTDDAGDVAVHHRFRHIKSQSEKTCRRVGAETFQFLHFFAGAGKFAAMVADDGFCRFVQRARAAVVAQPLPEGKNFLFRGAGQTFYRRQTAHKTFKIAKHGFDRCLLEHEFGNKNGIRVGMRAALYPPGKAAPVEFIPVQEPRR